MKQKARHAALTELANMILPSLMEDIKSEEDDGSKGMSGLMAGGQSCEEDEDDKEKEVKEEKKPRIVGLSLTRIMGAQANNKPASKEQKSNPKKRS